MKTKLSANGLIPHLAGLILFLATVMIFACRKDKPEVTTTSGYTKLLDFTGTNGSNPYGDLVFDGTFLYGMAGANGSSNGGVIFKIKPDGTGYVKLLDFTGINGSEPSGSLIYDGTFLYGTTWHGGTNSLGVIFKIKTDGTWYSKLLDFDGTLYGSEPSGSLFYDGTFLYGMTRNSYTNGMGTIFKIKPDGTGYIKLLDFNGANGSYASGSLISDGTFLYGMAGLIFKIKPDGTGYVTLLNFNGANGQNPYGSLIYDGAFLYGMTYLGGTGSCSSGCGVIFKIKPDGTGYTKLHDFTGNPDGSNPRGSLMSDGTFLYGMTFYAGTGSGGGGTTFKIKPDGTGYVKLLDFTDATGNYPSGSFISEGGFLYGMTSGGGSANEGTIFKYKL